MVSPRAILDRVRRRQAFDPAQHWRQRVAAFEAENRARTSGASWVLLGDSLVEGFPRALLWAADPRFVNRGIAGDHLESAAAADGIVRRLESAQLAHDPQRVLVLAGINDLGDHPDEPELVLERHARVLARLRALYPRASLTIVTLLPVRGRHAHLTASVRAINRALPTLAQKHGASVFDLHARFVDPTGALRAVFSRDGLHLTRTAYTYWAALLRMRADEPVGTGD